MIEQLLKAYPSSNRRDRLRPDGRYRRLFFRVLVADYERRSLGIGSLALALRGREALPRRAVSLLNPLLHHGIVVATSGEALR